ncbi:hypothetical protein PF003_g39296 [Phytophthora fragariae]|nr:hypothetical protein PF003_g39296 [Phytophthora fragariae]
MELANSLHGAHCAQSARRSDAVDCFGKLGDRPASFALQTSEVCLQAPPPNLQLHLSMYLAQEVRAVLRICTATHVAVLT